MGQNSRIDSKDPPSLAPGNKELLEKSADRKDIGRGNFTRVTTLSYDEVDPS